MLGTVPSSAHWEASSYVKLHISAKVAMPHRSRFHLSLLTTVLPFCGSCRPLLFRQPGSEQGTVHHTQLAELHRRQDTTVYPGAGGAIADAISISPLFDALQILLRPYQSAGVQLFQFHACSVTICSIRTKYPSKLFISS